MTQTREVTMMVGKVHSIETCGTGEGPGLRYVIFLQGCLLRCQYCHNPDSWKINAGHDMSIHEIIDDMKDYLPYFQASGGGVTVSGGEPLLQIDFLIELFKQCKQLGIHTTIDTSGGCFSRHEYFLTKLEELLVYTDLILLDIKHIDRDKHKQITEVTNDHIIDFAQYLSEKRVPIWIRHVLVPKLTDFDDDLMKLAQFIRTLNNVEKVEVLPYHELGVYKWESLGLDYKLKHTLPPTPDRVENAKQILGAL